MKKILIKDIAAKLGISNAAVSIVLSGKNHNKRVSEKLAKKIVATAKKLNYQPNNIAASLKTGKTKTVGLIVADISNPFFGQIAYFIQKEMEKNGYTVIIVNSDESKEQMAAMVSMLRSRLVDGFIIVPTEDCEELIAELIEIKQPTVLIDRDCPNLPVYSVMMNNYKAAYEATNYLIKKGCKKIPFMVYKNKLSNMLERRRGYEEAMREAGLYNDSLIYEIDHAHFEEELEIAMKQLLSSKEKVDGIFYSTNMLALNSLNYFTDQQLEIGKDIQVVSFDKNNLFRIFPTFVPYIEQPIFDMCERAVKLLLEQMEDSSKVGKEERILLSYKFCKTKKDC